MATWQGGHQYNVGDMVTNGGNAYVCTRAGQSDSTVGATGPTGTGSSITDGTPATAAMPMPPPPVIWAYFVEQTDSQVFVVYVPPTGSDTTVESCLRLGGGPPQGAVTDETVTYGDVVGRANPLTHLSPTYNTSSGIALLTPGVINLVAAGGVNTTSGVFSGNTIASSTSTIGSAYDVMLDPSGGHVISATYTNNDLGTWATASFNRASTTAVTTVPLQASLTTAIASYALSGPIAFNNAYGVTFGSMIGLAFTAQLARVTNIGWRTIVSNQWDGSNNAYYTKDQQSTTSAGFAWSVPVTDKYASFDSMQNRWCTVVNVGTAVVDLLALGYSVWGAGASTAGSPSDVQAFLAAAEPMAIVCTALNGLLAVAAFALGIIVDNFVADTKRPQPPNPHNAGATSFTVLDGNAKLQTGDDDAAPSLNLIDVTVGAAPPYTRTPVKQITLAAANSETGPRIRITGMNGLMGADQQPGKDSVTLGKATKGVLTASDDCLLLEFGTGESAVSIKLDANGILLSAGTHSINVTSNGIQIAGQTLTMAATNQAASQAATSATRAAEAAGRARDQAHNAAERARRIQEAVDAALNSARRPPAAP
jgi:hypothetical protein